MLDGYGLHQLTWDTCDERFGEVLVASPADSNGRGIALNVRQDGAAANLTGATVYLVWRHMVTGERGTKPFTAVNAAVGTFEVYYPAAMQDSEGAVQEQQYKALESGIPSESVFSDIADAIRGHLLHAAVEDGVLGLSAAALQVALDGLSLPFSHGGH